MGRGSDRLKERQRLREGVTAAWGMAGPREQPFQRPLAATEVEVSM